MQLSTLWQPIQQQLRDTHNTPAGEDKLKVSAAAAAAPSLNGWKAAYSQNAMIMERAVRLLAAVVAAATTSQATMTLQEVMRVPRTRAALAQLVSSSLVHQARLTPPRSTQQLQPYGLLCSLLKLSSFKHAPVHGVPQCPDPSAAQPDGDALLELLATGSVDGSEGPPSS